MRAVWSAPEAGRAHEAEACLRPYTHSKLAGGFEGIANLCRSLADLGGETAHFDRKFGPFEFSGALRDLVGTRSSTDFGFFFGGFFISFSGRRLFTSRPGFASQRFLARRGNAGSQVFQA